MKRPASLRETARQLVDEAMSLETAVLNPAEREDAQRAIDRARTLLDFAEAQLDEVTA